MFAYEALPNGCLFFGKREIRKTNRRRRITLHHDNASSHTSTETIAFLSTKNIDLISHSPHSPDLARNDCFLFPYIKNKLRSQRFSTPEKAVYAFRVAKVIGRLIQTHAKVYRS